ncbi:MAG: YigZ family protein [Thermoplasmatota archaeon]
MEEMAAVKYVESRSRFFAHLYRIESREEIDGILKLHRRNYRKAVHHCYAVRLSEGGSVSEESRDDGEVGHPGKVLLDLMRRKGLEQHLLVVSRIFGGIKLGVGGVSRAFRSSGQAVLEQLD